jgi:hypothetical protein
MQMAQAISNYCTHVARGCFEAAEKYSVTQKIIWSNNSFTVVQQRFVFVSTRRAHGV